MRGPGTAALALLLFGGSAAFAEEPPAGEEEEAKAQGRDAGEEKLPPEGAETAGEEEAKAQGEDADEEQLPTEGAEPGTGGAGLETAHEQKRGLDAIGVPLVSYNSDLGWGLGIVGGGYYYSPGYDPYRHALAAQGFITTEGVRNHWLRYDGPSLIGNARLEVRAEYRRELFAPFYGAGNLSGQGFLAGKSEEQPWSYDYFYPGGFARVRWHPVRETHPLEVYGAFAYHYVKVRPYERSALERLGPLGLEGGHHGELSAGALWDSRDFEADPVQGGVEEIAVRVSTGATASRYDYVGLTLSERRFWQLGTPKLILAQRIVFDALWGDAPFFEWSNIGGTQGGEGIGGMSSVRGVPRNRYQGKAKLVSNTELRFYAFDFPLFGERTKVGGVGFFDVGRVWHPGVEDGGWLSWHPGTGAGLRMARRAAVLRFDVGMELETGRPGIYVTFGHMF